jgi:hypothetical protein
MLGLSEQNRFGGNPCGVLEHAPNQTAFVKEDAKERARAKRLWDNYKLTIAQYDAIFAFQGGVCYACQQPEPVKGRRLSVDHCHDTGLIRGLLCSRCNPIIGKLENAYKRYGLGKVLGLTVQILAHRIAVYLSSPTATNALGAQHFGYTGRTGTKAHRKRLRKERRSMTGTRPPVTP